MKNENYLNLHIITSKKEKAEENKTQEKAYVSFIKNISTSLEIKKKKQIKNIQIVRIPTSKNLIVKKVKKYNNELAKIIKEYKITTTKICLRIQKLIYINCMYGIIQGKKNGKNLPGSEER